MPPDEKKDTPPAAPAAPTPEAPTDLPAKSAETPKGPTIEEVKERLLDMVKHGADRIVQKADRLFLAEFLGLVAQKVQAKKAKKRK